ncbi:MAG: hypothetical protein M3R61_14335 [Chloroflexota bacterium]|nr:hypothetical protein [Chloroflexota bacterium]
MILVARRLCILTSKPPISAAVGATLVVAHNAINASIAGEQQGAPLRSRCTALLPLQTSVLSKPHSHKYQAKEADFEYSNNQTHAGNGE